jgi:2-oxo-3-(phosphooxy)propyl 3-oxoalkanoate synthase
MTFDPKIEATAAETKLSYERTVERSLVHRAAVGEVFVTDVHIADPNRYLAGAQLPPGHGYYGDHCQRPAFDTLLLLESCRQASIYGAHRAMGLPVDSPMMVSDWSIRLDARACPAPGPTPGELGLVDTVRARRGPRGDVRGLRFDLELWMARRQVGRAHITVGCTTAEQYAVLRRMQRGDDPPKTADLAAAAPTGAGPDGGGDPVRPELVGRWNPANVVLADPVRDGEEVSARLAPRLDHPSLFDHSYDHYPAMVLMEAARQLGLLAFGAGRTVATGFDAGFERFAELDAPIVARARPRGRRDGHGEDHDEDPVTAAEVIFEQGGERIARSAVDLVDVADLRDQRDPRWKGAA